MSRKKENREKYATNIDSSILKRTQNYSSETGIPITRIIDKALEEFLDKYENKKE